MCPLCMTTAALVAAGAASGGGVLGFVVIKFRALRRQRRERTSRLPSQLSNT
jgi:hypothetical protein